MTSDQDYDRTVLKISGGDREKFLQDLITNDISGGEDRLTYAALLSPQGKFLFDFFLFKAKDRIFLDVRSTDAAALSQRLTLYRLRADVKIEATTLIVSRGLEKPPKGAMADPRNAALGWRYYGDTPLATPDIDWDNIRVTNVIPETGSELVSNESYILEVGFERLNGVDFRKGCYVGQEITARMKHKTELRKGLASVQLTGSAVEGDEITLNGKPVGRLHTISQDRAIAYIRFDRADDGMVAGDASVKLL